MKPQPEGRAHKETQMDSTDQFRAYVADPRLQHRDQTMLNLERKIAECWRRGMAPSAIAIQLKMPVSQIIDIVA
jgi:hypothetical protein